MFIIPQILICENEHVSSKAAKKIFLHTACYQQTHLMTGCVTDVTGRNRNHNDFTSMCEYIIVSNFVNFQQILQLIMDEWPLLIILRRDVARQAHFLTANAEDVAIVCDQP